VKLHLSKMTHRHPAVMRRLLAEGAILGVVMDLDRAAVAVSGGAAREQVQPGKTSAVFGRGGAGHPRTHVTCLGVDSPRLDMARSATAPWRPGQSMHLPSLESISLHAGQRCASSPIRTP